MWDASFAPVPPGRQLGSSGVVKTARGRRDDFTSPRRSRYRQALKSALAAKPPRYEHDSIYRIEMEDAGDTRPILIVPYMWIGDFVRGHTVVRVLKQRWPNRPVDLLVTSLCAPLVDYMPGVRSGIVWDLPRSRLAVARQWGLAAAVAGQRLRHRAGAAAHLEVGDCARAGRDPGTGGFCRRSQVRADQPMALGREGPAPLHRQECGTGAARRRAAAGRMAGAAAAGSRRGSRPLAAGQRAGHRSRRRTGAGLGRRLQALDLLSGGRAAAGRTRPRCLGGRRSRRKGAGGGDRGRRRRRASAT